MRALPGPSSIRPVSGPGTPPAGGFGGGRTPGGIGQQPMTWIVSVVLFAAFAGFAFLMDHVTALLADVTGSGPRTHYLRLVLWVGVGLVIFLVTIFAAQVRAGRRHEAQIRAFQLGALYQGWREAGFAWAVRHMPSRQAAVTSITVVDAHGASDPLPGGSLAELEPNRVHVMEPAAIRADRSWSPQRVSRR